jgi:glycine cleavage system transcriptional repressor
MKNWYMLSLVGRDRPSIVAELSAGLCKSGCNLGDSSMARLGGNFTIMLMVQHAGSLEAVEAIVQPIAGALGLNHHLVAIEGGVHHDIEPDVRISLYTQDRMGVVEDVTGPLAGAGLNILHLDSNVSDDEDSPTYYIHIEGTVAKGIEPIYRVLETLSDEKKIKSQLIPINPEVA